MADFAFLDFNGFRARTLMPPEDVDAVEAAHAGWILQQLVDGSAYLRSRLDKRYGPWEAPYPNACGRWLAAMVTVRAYMKRGVNPSDAQFELIKADADLAVAEVKEAADSSTGLFDLPLRQDSDASGIARGTPLSHSEAGPYEWTDLQLEAVLANE